MKRLLFGVGLLLTAAACQPTPTLLSVPTLTLMPVTPTATVTPPPPTPTPPPTAPDNALLASTLLAATPTPPGFAANTADLPAGLNPVAAELVQIARRRIAEQLDLPLRRVRLVDVQPFRWTDSSLGCPLPGQTYVPVLSDGYRVVLAVGDAVYYFHTDFDRALPCDIGLERLPEGTPLPTIPPTPTPVQAG